MRIEVRGPQAATAKDRRDALREAFRYLAALWDKLYKMRRFTDAGVRLYKLRPRAGEPGSGVKYKGSYTEAKAKRRANGLGSRAIGETKPFVWSGDSRERVRQQHKIVATAASSSRAKAENIFDVPTFNLRPKGGRIHLRREFETVLEEERKTLEELGIRHYENSINRTPPVFMRIA